MKTDKDDGKKKDKKKKDKKKKSKKKKKKNKKSKKKKSKKQKKTGEGRRKEDFNLLCMFGLCGGGGGLQVELSSLKVIILISALKDQP